MKIAEMMQERAKITNQMRELVNTFDSKEMDSLAKENMAKLEKAFDDISAKIDMTSKVLDAERIEGEIASKSEVKTSKSDLFAKALSGKEEHIKTYKNTFKLTDDGQAGYLTAPVEFVNEVIRGLDNFNHMRTISRVISGVGNAQSLGFPYRKTSPADALWTAEISAAAEETTLDFGRREFKPNKLARLIKLSKTLMNHAPLAESALQTEIIERINAAQENAYMNGNGTAQPLGIFTASASGISTGRDVATGNTATAVTFDGLVNAKFNNKQQYHANASWVGSRDLAKMVTKIKDGTGNYIWQPSVQAGTPDRLLGAPFYMSEYAPKTFTTGLYVGVYGDFKHGYMIADSNAIAIQVLSELYAVTNQIGYLVDYFGDGAPIVEEAFSRIKLG